MPSGSKAAVSAVDREGSLAHLHLEWHFGHLFDDSFHSGFRFAKSTPKLIQFYVS